MKMLMWGAETQSLANRGWTKTGAGAVSYVGAGAQRRSPNLNGGSWALQLGDPAFSAEAESPNFEISVVESLHRVGMYHDSSGTWQYRLRNGGATIASARVNGFGNVALYVNGALQATSASALAAASWHTLTIRYRMLAASGLFEVFAGNDQVTPIVTFSGNTDPTAATDIEAIQLSDKGGRYDDVTVQAISMRWKTGTQAPVVGEILTGAGGATCVVTAIETGSTNAAGRALVRSVFSTFVDGESVTGDVAAVFNNNAPAATTANPSSVDGLDTNSGLPTTFGFIRLEVPDAPGAFTECTPVPVVANWQNVDDWASTAADEANFVTGATTGDRDFYGTTDLAGSFTGVEGVEVLLWAVKQGAFINNVEPGIRPAATEHYGPVQPLGAAYGPHSGGILDLNPEDGENWTPTDVNGAEVGFRLTA